MTRVVDDLSPRGRTNVTKRGGEFFFGGWEEISLEKVFKRAWSSSSYHRASLASYEQRERNHSHAESVSAVSPPSLLAIPITRQNAAAEDRAPSHGHCEPRRPARLKSRSKRLHSRQHETPAAGQRSHL
ncbi:hypothetical protein FKM82_007659 [Ascaphus truei]